MARLYNLMHLNQRNGPSLQLDAPHSNLVQVSASDYISSKLPVNWLNPLFNHVKLTTENEVLIVLD
jgi:hypothetical protein